MTKRSLILVAGIILSSSLNAQTILPGALPLFDDAQYPTTEDKADRFSEYLYPLIERENSRYLDHHYQIIDVQQAMNEGRPISDNQEKAIKHLFKEYGLDTNTVDHDSLKELELRALPVPPSLVIAHALVEDRWNANLKTSSLNLFDIPCLPEKCDQKTLDEITPRHYSSINDVIEDYIQNVNTNPAFREFRVQRLSDFMDGKVISGIRYARYWDVLLSGDSSREALMELMNKHNLIQYDSWR